MRDFFICYFIYIAQEILVPLAFAVLLAVLLFPIVNFLESRNVSRILSIAISLFLAIIAGVGNTFRR
jgi:predicted PurR-regulated permease PerM